MTVLVVNGNDFKDLTDGRLIYLAGPYRSANEAENVCRAANRPIPDKCFAKLLTG